MLNESEKRYVHEIATEPANGVERKLAALVRRLDEETAQLRAALSTIRINALDELGSATGDKDSARKVLNWCATDANAVLNPEGGKDNGGSAP